MDLLKGYGSSGSDQEDPMEMGDDDQPTSSSAAAQKFDILDATRMKTLCLPSVNLVPQVVAAQEDVRRSVAIVDPKTKELYHNPTFEQLFQPEVRLPFV
jgi:hypothetical protein